MKRLGMVMLIVLSFSICALAQVTETKSSCETAKEKQRQADNDRLERVNEAMKKGEMPSPTDLITPPAEVDAMFRLCDEKIKALEAKIQESLRRAKESVKIICEGEVHPTKRCTELGIQPKLEVLQSYYKVCETLKAKGEKNIPACTNLIPLPSDKKKP
jgi:hypothetical protein